MPGADYTRKRSLLLHCTAEILPAEPRLKGFVLVPQSCAESESRIIFKGNARAFRRNANLRGWGNQADGLYRGRKTIMSYLQSGVASRPRLSSRVHWKTTMGVLSTEQYHRRDITWKTRTLWAWKPCLFCPTQCSPSGPGAIDYELNSNEQNQKRYGLKIRMSRWDGLIILIAKCSGYRQWWQTWKNIPVCGILAIFFSFWTKEFGRRGGRWFPNCQTAKVSISLSDLDARLLKW